MDTVFRGTFPHTQIVYSSVITREPGEVVGYDTTKEWINITQRGYAYFVLCSVSKWQKASKTAPFFRTEVPEM
jgi:hypothetical protein